ncbi:hypothetical protein AWB74_02608 [Caballeronia arvi]|uniref:Uncharacterized protein n=1 Tax=Caballeronia arvi TaxID=1777135 RepID=A0A158IJN7_9BURK|nr:hypothetical protein [Caballeronia arvi]SAL56764.1 hypothetical protein AWB74_02608 [Caballeronia arvi]
MPAEAGIEGEAARRPIGALSLLLKGLSAQKKKTLDTRRMISPANGSRPAAIPDGTRPAGAIAETGALSRLISAL